MDEWYLSYFDEDYLRLYEPHLTPEREGTEVEGIEKALGLPKGADILDLCCGQGRHTVPLAQRGYRMSGLDLSETLLRHARERACSAGVQVHWHQADMREIPWAGRFDAVINMFTAFGYIRPETENQKVLDGVCRALKPGGLFLIEMAHRDRIVKQFLPRDWFQTADGTIAWQEREMDPVAGASVQKTTYRTPDGQLHHRQHWTRLYTPTELTAMLRAAGLAPLKYWGGLDLSPLTTSTRLMVLARRER